MQASKGIALKASDYKIEFNKLRMGSNTFEFILDDAFFQSIEGGVITGASVKVDLEMVKSENMYALDFIFKGHVNSACDNCLNEILLPIESEFHLIMKLSETEDYSDDEIIYITKGLLEYDFSQYLYESTVLSIPQRRVCEMANQSCNEEVVAKINNFVSEEGNEDETNPMWDKLKGIFNKN